MPRSDRSITVDKGACACGADIYRRRIGRKKTQCPDCEATTRNARQRALMRAKASAKREENRLE